jgi:hypothetical protein
LDDNDNYKSDTGMIVKMVMSFFNIACTGCSQSVLTHPVAFLNRSKIFRIIFWIRFSLCRFPAIFSDYLTGLESSSIPATDRH